MTYKLDLNYSTNALAVLNDLAEKKDRPISDIIGRAILFLYVYESLKSDGHELMVANKKTGEIKPFNFEKL